MRWVPSLSLTNYLRAVVALAVFTFLARWAGHGNLPGPDPRGWGDPIPFAEALAQLPSEFVVSLITVGLLVIVHGIRSSAPEARVDTAGISMGLVSPATDESSTTLSCPVCRQNAVSLAGGTWICGRCGQELRLADPGGLASSVANIAGFGTAFLTGFHGIGFLFAWFLTSYAVMGSIRLMAPPRLEAEVPREFHRALP